MGILHDTTTPAALDVRYLIYSSAVQGDLIGCRTGNGEKLSSSQAEPEANFSMVSVRIGERLQYEPRV